jgi:CTP synthase (UTP-ammonia lyase)
MQLQRVNGSTGMRPKPLIDQYFSTIADREAEVNTGPAGYNSDMVKLGVIGDYNSAFESHPAIGESVRLAGQSIGVETSVEWLPTTDVSEGRLCRYDALWASAGSPYLSFAGMLDGIRFARKRRRPFLGTCGGFQHALVEYARNVVGIAKADSAEHNVPDAVNVITPVMCALPGVGESEPKLSGFDRIEVVAGTRLAEVIGKSELRERYFCNYEVNEEFRERFESAGLVFSALGPKGEVRAMELREHPFFLATLFQPQLTSKASGVAHPVIEALLRAGR